MPDDATNLPPCKILFRSKDGVEVFEVSSNREDKMEPAGERKFLVKGGTTVQTMAPDGSCAYILMTGYGVIRVPLSDSVPADPLTKGNTPPFLAHTSAIQMMEISPLGSYLVTWERVTDAQPDNLKVWSTKTGEFLCGFPQKGLSRAGFPYCHWTADEQFAMLMTTNEVRIFPAHSFLTEKQEARFIHKVRVPGITSLSVPRERGGNTLPSSPHRFTSFVPGDKNMPAKASLHEYNASSNSSASLTTKSIFQAEDMKTSWSPNGSIALVTLQTSVDTSGKSYYGSATLFLLGATDSTDAKAVPLPQEGPVMDISWMPNATKSPCFVVIAGRMPTMASMHNGITAEPIFLFGNAHRNTICWAPHGRFVCLAGFGNLAGGMSFWDRNKLKLIPPTGQNTASCTVGYGWSPDSRLFGVSTTTPRMNVDNGYRLFRYNGEEVTGVPWDNKNYMPDKLLEACFVPALPTVYPDRPQSPTLKMADSAGSDAGSSITEVKKAAGRYIPPSQRGKQTGGMSLAERMAAAKESQMKGAQVVVGQPQKAVSAATGKVIPGLVQASDQAKSKSAIKREKAKLAKQKKEEEARLQAQAEAAARAAPVPVVGEPTEPVDPEKRARKIKKTLKQIDDLKKKPAGELNEDQQNKVDSESSLREELAKLGL